MTQHSASLISEVPLADPSPQYAREVASVRDLISALQPDPLLLASSPHSTFAARLFATMYERRFGILTRCCGIEELVRSVPYLTSNGVLIVGLEPETPALIGALESCVAYEPCKLGVLCGAHGELCRIARSANAVVWAEVPANAAAELAAIFEDAFFGTVHGANASIEATRDDSDRPEPSIETTPQPFGTMQTGNNSTTSPVLMDWPTAAFRRKARALGLSIQSEGISDSFMRILDHQIARLNSQEFRALIVDYDGTLWCPPEEGRVTDVVELLDPLLRNGVVIGIATGRDHRLASHLISKFDSSLRKNVWLGSANGSNVVRLEPSECCDELCLDLQPLKAALESDPFLRHVATISSSQRQLTIAAKRLCSSHTLWHLAGAYARRSGVRGIQVVTSTHSIDILAPGAAKANLFDAFQTLGIGRDHVLCIGDRGRWPGNDFELLEHDFSLSVDEPSPCWSCGWNMAPPGCRGPAAMRFYLQHMLPKEGGLFQLNLPADKLRQRNDSDRFS